MSVVFLSLGSNQQRLKNLRFAINELTAEFGDLVKSNTYKNTAVGFSGNDFYNLVVKLETDYSVLELNDFLKKLESSAGRDHSMAKFSGRTLDVDILLFDDLVLHPEFDIPRNEIMIYSFVLQPLSEIAPNLKHPISQLTMLELWQGFDQTAKLTNIIEL